MTTDNQTLEAFRAEVKAFLKEAVTPELASRVRQGLHLSREELAGWQSTLNDRGWGAVHWPVEYGGTGWTAWQRYIFEEELAANDAPIALRNAVHICGPSIIKHGSQEQKDRFLKPILSGEEIWVLGYSEPGAGSDLASLRTKAVLEGDHYVVNGQKIWSSIGHWSQWCMLLTRTSDEGPKQAGITILLVDMTLPGITVRPILTIEGNHHFNEIFFDNVKVPVSFRLGEENKGWGYLAQGLGAERLFLADVGRSKTLLGKLKQIAAAEMRGNASLLEDRAFRLDIAALEVRLHALEFTVLRLLDAPDGPTASDAAMLKLRGTELAQDIGQLTSEAVGYYALPFDEHVLHEGWGDDEPVGPEYAAAVTPFYFFWRKASISGGTSEIQKNIIAKQILGKL